MKTAVILITVITTGSLALPEFTARGWHHSLWRLLNDILEKELPPCELLLFQDFYFTGVMNDWLVDFPYPYYSVTMDGKPFPDYYGWRQIAKTAGFKCTTIIATCLTFNSCRSNNSDEIYNMLNVNKMLLKERRTLLYVDEASVAETTSRVSKILNESTSWSFTERPVTYQEQDAKEYTIPYLNKAKAIVNDLHSHIIVIREVGSHADTRELANGTIFYETTTFSPNWLPGGTPVLRNIWSSKNGFSFHTSLTIDLDDIRDGGRVRFCAATTSFPPMLYVKNELIQGIDGEMVKIFQRQFMLDINIQELHDTNDNGQLSDEGNWTGVMGHIVRREADFGIGRVTFTQERFNSGLKISPGLTIITAVAVCPLPKLLPRFVTLIQPFDQSTWIFVGVSSLVIVSIIQLMQKIALRIKHNYRERYVSVLDTAGPILRHSVPLQSFVRRWSTLGLMGLWMLTAVVICSSYTSVLIGALTVPIREARVMSPYDLIDRNLPFVVAPVVEKAIEVTVMPQENEMYQRRIILEPDPAYIAAPDLQVFAYVRQTGRCAVAEKLRTTYVVGKSENSTLRGKFRRLYISRDSILIGPTGWVMRSDMDFMLEHYFDRAFKQFRAYGFLSKTMSDFNDGDVAGTANSDDEFRSISLEAVGPIFILALIGLGSSILIFLIELLVYKTKLHKTRGDPNIVP